MLLAKLKGILLGTGMMALVVSGAVVLAQPGGQERAPQPPDTDRAAAMEKKLDRILDALDRLSGIVPPGQPREMQTRVNQPVDLSSNVDIDRSKEPVEATAEFAENVFVESTNDPQQVHDSPQAGRVGPPLPRIRDTRPLPLADRMETVEKELRTVEHRLKQIEQRLTELDQRVGGASSPSKANPPNNQPRLRLDRPDLSP